MKTCNVGISSIRLWFYPNGDMSKPTLAFADANCNLRVGVVRDEIKNSESCDAKKENFVEFSMNHKVKIRGSKTNKPTGKFLKIIESESEFAK